MKKINQDGAVHAVGNGRLLVYGEGADIINVYGAPYSSPSVFKGQWSLISGEKPVYASERVKHTNIWSHDFVTGDKVVAHSEEFVSPHLPIYLTEVITKVPLQLLMPVAAGSTCTLRETDKKGGCRSFYVIGVSPSSSIYVHISGQPAYWTVAFQGDDCRTEIVDGVLSVSFAPGVSHVYIAGGPSLPEAELHLQAGLQIPYADHRTMAALKGRELADRIAPISQRGMEDNLYKRIQELSEGTAFLICAQQSEDGGLMAGHNYALAYARDQYGACRGLLALGLYEEARRNLEFRCKKWHQFGNLQNAESMGHDRVRHIHENDEVEVTAYTILQAFDYAKDSGDWGFLKELFPMLDWCWRVQIPHLLNGMLPFNGDETYIACGYLGRESLNDGSMEATLLFLEAGLRLIPYARSKGYWGEAEAAGFDKLVLETAALFRTHFYHDGGFVANAPERAFIAPLPEYRHGVCEQDWHGGLRWTKRTSTNRYLCDLCYAEGMEAAVSQPIQVNSSLLLPSFIDSQIITEREKRENLQRTMAIFREKGYLPTLLGGNSFVGYDAGLLLYGLVQLSEQEAAHEVLGHVLNIADSADAWVEVYLEGKPFNTRCRPWESGMNIAAILLYANCDKDEEYAEHTIK
jgi:hypothetical protein